MRVFFIKGCNSPSKGQLQETGLNNRTVSNLGLKMMGFTSIFGHFHVENDDKLVDFRDARNSTHNFMPFHQNFFYLHCQIKMNIICVYIYIYQKCVYINYNIYIC